MDLTNAPGVEYLSPSEKSLCSELHILPGYYLVVKARFFFFFFLAYARKLAGYVTCLYCCDRASYYTQTKGDLTLDGGGEVDSLSFYAAREDILFILLFFCK